MPKKKQIGAAKRAAKKKLVRGKTPSVTPATYEAVGLNPLPGTKDLPINPNLPTHHADMVNMLFTNQGQTFISFFSRTPGQNVEECRVTFANSLAQKMVELICQHLNYYPERLSNK